MLYGLHKPLNDDYGNFPDVKPHIDFPNSPSGTSLRYRENCLLESEMKHQKMINKRHSIRKDS